jgi:hypothetical protein
MALSTWKICGYHPAIDWRSLLAIARGSIAFVLTISGGYVFDGIKEMPTTLK